MKHIALPAVYLSGRRSAISVAAILHDFLHSRPANSRRNAVLWSGARFSRCASVVYCPKCGISGRAFKATLDCDVWGALIGIHETVTSSPCGEAERAFLFWKHNRATVLALSNESPRHAHAPVLVQLLPLQHRKSQAPSLSSAPGRSGNRMLSTFFALCLTKRYSQLQKHFTTNGQDA